MSDKTGIEWTDATWNPLRGCSRVSEGCRHCYAETVAARFSGPGQPYDGLATRSPARWTGKVALVEKHLADPLRWTRPRRIFVNSMSDLFHEAVPDEWIDQIFAVMALAPQHTFQVLTKRPERMRNYCEALVTGKRKIGDAIRTVTLDGFAARLKVAAAFGVRPGSGGEPPYAPFPNVWLGVSVEDQATADARIPLLLQTPAAVRFVSYEPALGPIDFSKLTRVAICDDGDLTPGRDIEINEDGALLCAGCGNVPTPWEEESLDWIICGGESGPGARPFDIAWARSTIAQCRAAEVACFMKQLGARPQRAATPEELEDTPFLPKRVLVPLLRDRKGGDMAEWPEDLRIREFPR